MCVDELLIEDNMCCGVKIKNGEKIFAGCVIATLPPNQLAKISSRLPDYVNIFPQSAIMSVEIATHKPIHNKKYVAYIGTNIQWLFNMDLLFNHKSDVYHYRATISRADDIIGFSNAELCEIFANELQQIAGIERCDIVAMKIVKNRNATSLLTFANNEQRPSAVQNIKGLYLAGDWINTGLPATAESAALSGKRVADCIFELN
jgi:protoporphyrinogen oxidase